MNRLRSFSARSLVVAVATATLVIASVSVAHAEWFGPEQRLTFNDADQRWPEISGTKLAFYCVNSIGGPGPEDDEYDIGLLDVVTDELINLTPQHTAASKPAISGSDVVWRDRGSGTAAAGIYHHDLKTRKTRRLPITSGSDLRVSGGKLVYSADRGTGPSIYLFDLRTNKERRITPNGAKAGMPDVSGNAIVWQDRRNGSDFDIYAFDLVTGAERRLTTNAADQINPRIAGKKVVWQDARRGALVHDIYLYDLATRTERPVTDEPAMQSNPAISGSTVVWQDERHGDSEIYLYDIAMGIEKRVTTNAAYQGSPSISGNRVVYDDNLRPGITGMDLYLVQKVFPTLTSKTSSVIKYRTASKVTGHLKSATGAPLAGKTVRLEVSKNKRTWSRQGTAVTAADGSYALYSPRITTRRYLRVRFTGDADHPPALSATSRVRARVHYTAAPRFKVYSQKYGSTYKVWGYIKPEHRSASTQIKVRAYRYEKRSNGKYAYVYKKTYKTKTSNARGSSYTKYTGSIRLPQTGKWRLRAYHGADTLNATSYSKYRYVRVRR